MEIFVRSGLRTGAVQDMTNKGYSVEEIMEVTHHTDPKSVARYADIGNSFPRRVEFFTRQGAEDPERMAQESEARYLEELAQARSRIAYEGAGQAVAPAVPYALSARDPRVGVSGRGGALL